MSALQPSCASARRESQGRPKVPIREVVDRPGWYDVRVYDRVQAPWEKPKPIDRRVKGERVAQDTERELKNLRDRGSLSGRNVSLSDWPDLRHRSRRHTV